MKKCFIVGHNCDQWDNVYTEIKLFLQSLKFLYITAQLLTHCKLSSHSMVTIIHRKKKTVYNTE